MGHWIETFREPTQKKIYTAFMLQRVQHSQTSVNYSSHFSAPGLGKWHKTQGKGKYFRNYVTWYIMDPTIPFPAVMRTILKIHILFHQNTNCPPSKIFPLHQLSSGTVDGLYAGSLPHNPQARDQMHSPQGRFDPLVVHTVQWPFVPCTCIPYVYLLSMHLGFFCIDAWLTL